ncbi:MAG: hypothetical protein P1U86_09225 [Verrucomicrobiales bacterium]|nr:hypothetical protein [Verrucomicrobiales bacterium]
MTEDRERAETPVVKFSEVVLDFQSASSPLSFALHQGEFAFLKAEALALVALGIKQAYAGEIEILGETWESRTVRSVERDRRRISYVADSDSETSTEWVGNLDVDENVLLGALFDRGIGSKAAFAKMEKLASRLGLEKGVPSTRPDSTSVADLVRSQWVRAFMPDDLALVILENPLEGAPRKFIPDFINMVRESLSNGVAVIWVSEEWPDFDKLGLIPEFEF